MSTARRLARRQKKSFGITGWHDYPGFRYRNPP
jgi:hypothetical protein